VEIVGNSGWSSWKDLQKYSIIFSKCNSLKVSETLMSKKENSGRKLSSFFKYSQILLLACLQEQKISREDELLKPEANYSKAISYSLANEYFIYYKLSDPEK